MLASKRTRQVEMNTEEEPVKSQKILTWFTVIFLFFSGVMVGCSVLGLCILIATIYGGISGILTSKALWIVFTIFGIPAIITIVIEFFAIKKHQLEILEYIKKDER